MAGRPLDFLLSRTVAIQPAFPIPQPTDGLGFSAHEVERWVWHIDCDVTLITMATEESHTNAKMHSHNILIFKTHHKKGPASEYGPYEQYWVPNLAKVDTNIIVGIVCLFQLHVYSENRSN